MMSKAKIRVYRERLLGELRDCHANRMQALNDMQVNEMVELNGEFERLASNIDMLDLILND